MKRLRLDRVLIPAALVAALIAGLFLMSRPRANSGAPRTGLFEPILQQASTKVFAATSKSPDRDAGLDAMFAARQLIRTATLSLTVKRHADAAREAAAVAEAHGGFVANAKSSREDGGRERGTLTVRVPADRFRSALDALKRLGRVEAASLETQDVTKEYTDLSARLAAKRDAEERLREILQTRTAGLADLVAAEQERTRLIEEIETLEGERRYYDRQVAFSTIALELSEPAAFLRGGALAPLADAVRGSVPLLASSAAALVYAAAAALPWALLGLVVWRLRRRFASRRLIRVAMEN